MTKRILSVLVNALVLIIGIAVIYSGCKKDDSPTSTGDGGGGVTSLSFNTPGQSLTVPATGGVVRAKLAGGTLPYFVQTPPRATVATVTIAGDTLSITPVGAGTDSVTVRDSSPTPEAARTVTIRIVVTGGGGGGGLTANPASISVGVGGTGASTVSGGTTPYSIQTPPNTSIATASIAGSIVTVGGVAQGQTSVVIRDNSSTPLTVSIPITVGGGGGQGSGTLSFASTAGNFSASGTYDPNATSGQGAGGVRSTSGGVDMLTVNAFSYTSPTDLSVAIVQIAAQGTLTTTTYAIPATGTVIYFAHVNPADTSTYRARTYSLYSGSKAITALSSNTAAGTFSGAGVNSQAAQITVSNGLFNVSYVTGERPASDPKGIDRIVRTLLQRSKQ